MTTRSVLFPPIRETGKQIDFGNLSSFFRLLFPRLKFAGNRDGRKRNYLEVRRITETKIMRLFLTAAIKSAVVKR